MLYVRAYSDCQTAIIFIFVTTCIMEHEAVLCGYDGFIWNLQVIHYVPAHAGMTVFF
jgi:hypothetical protein